MNTINNVFYFLFLILAAVNVTPTVADEISECRRLAPKYGAEIEAKLSDGTRCDLLSPRVAYEVDYARKWYSGIGQALHYALVTGRRPGLILLVRDPAKEWRHIYRAARVCGRHAIEFHIERIE